MNYYFNPNVSSVGQAFDEVNWWQVGRSSAEGMIPWKTPGGRLGRAAGTAVVDVLVNALNAGSDYTQEQAMKDFAVGFIGDLAGGGLGELVSKYGAPAVAKGLSRIGFDYKDIVKMIGGGIKNIDVTFNGVSAKRMMQGWVEGKVAVIGRNMERVRAFAKEAGGEVWTGWDPNLSKAQNLAKNKEWVEKLKREGYTVYDVGLDPAYASKGDLGKGEYYGMETTEIFGD